MSGSPCPTCRTPMRWIPAMQQWGCDTCRVMFPAQPVVQAFAMAMAPNKSNKGLVIGISVAAVVGAGVAITLIAMQHKKSAAVAADTGSGSAPAGSSGSASGSEAVAASGSGPVAAPIKQVPLPPTPPPAPKDLTLGTPEPMELGDFWLTSRKDGAFVVTSSLFEVVFPHRPTAKVERNVYTLSDDLQGRGLLQLQITAGGKDAGDSGRAQVAKAGTPIETHSTDRGQSVTRLEATSATTGETIRVDSRVDAPHDLLVVATTSFIKSDQATAADFLASIHQRPATDPFDDPKTLTVRVRKEHGKNEAHDAMDSFAIALPWTTKIARAPGARPVKVTATSTRGKASATLVVEEISAWEALAFSPASQKAFVETNRQALADSTKLEVKVASEKLAGIPAQRLDAKGRGHSYHTHLLWNRFQHRRYTLVCVDAPCDVVALSLKVAAPIAPR